MPLKGVRPVALALGFDLAGLLGDGRLVTGDPAHVPVGRYAEQSLRRLEVWSIAECRLVGAENVRAALALVERGEAPVGIVYASDAAASTRVAVAGVFPAASHAPIRYPIAIVAGRDAAPVRAAYAFLNGQAARSVLAAQGFLVDRGDAARTLGAGALDRFVTITLPLMLPGVLSGAIIAFAASLGEFGAVITFVSNIPGETQTLPALIYTFTQVPGGDAGAYRLTLVSVAVSMAALIASEWLAQRASRRIEVE